MKQTKNTAFTLVELIVVITILAVLATVAFISFQGYTSSSRDSVRLADLKNITKTFEIIRSKGDILPMPDQKIDITASGTIFQYQGVLEEQTLKLSNIHNGGLDPLTGKPYGYSVNTQRNKFQVIGFLENSQTTRNTIFSQSFANNTDKFVKTSGDYLGFLLNTNTNEIITQTDTLVSVDVSDENNNTLYKSVVTNNVSNTQNLQNTFIHIFNNIANCNTILLNGKSNGDGIYTINPSGTQGGDFEVFCDMTTDGGGWTLVSRINGKLDYLTTNSVGSNPTDFNANSTNKFSDKIINSLFLNNEFLIYQGLDNENKIIMRFQDPSVGWNSTVSQTRTDYRCVGGSTYYESGYSARTNINFIREGNCGFVKPKDNNGDIMSYGNYGIYMYADVREERSCGLGHCNTINQQGAFVPGSIWVK